MFSQCAELFDSVLFPSDRKQTAAKAVARQEIDCLLESSPLREKQHILNLCCGKGHHAMELASRGFGGIVGIDSKKSGIYTARKRARLEKLPVSFIEDDPRRCSFTIQGHDAVLVMGNALARFTNDRDAAAVLDTCRRALRPSGLLALAIADGDWLRRHFEAESIEWMPRSGFIARQKALRDSCLTTRVTVVAADDTVTENPVLTERVYTRASVESALRRTGFVNVSFSASIGSLERSGTAAEISPYWYLCTARAPAKILEQMPESRQAAIS